MLREAAAVQYARAAVPAAINGIRIVFPDVRVSLGLRITSRSRRLTGQDLQTALDNSEKRDFALEMAMTALEALMRADVTSDRFTLFGKLYRSVRRWEVLLAERHGTPILSSGQRRQLARLLREGSTVRNESRAVLVHGDLQPAHVIVNEAERWLAFVDLEMLHVSKPVMNFVQLWGGFHFADPLLGRELFRRYAARFPEAVDGQFDVDARTEIALRCYSQVRDGQRLHNPVMMERALALMSTVLSTESLDGLFTGEDA